MKRKDFERLVREAISSLPRYGLEALRNVSFVIEEEIRREKAHEVGIKAHEKLLGLYEGIPRTERGSGYFGVLPDKITLFQKPLEELGGGDSKKLKRLVREVAWHEIGHHLGLTDRDLRILEQRRAKKKA